MKTILFILLTSLTLSAKAQGIEAVLQQIEANNTTLAALRQQAEAEKLGFTDMIIPRYNYASFNHKQLNIRLHPVKKVEEALRALFG